MLKRETWKLQQVKDQLSAVPTATGTEGHTLLPCTQPTNTQLCNTLAPPDPSTQPAAYHFFSGPRVPSKHCSTTGQAMNLLKKETLHNPECLVIHHTDDLDTLHKDTAEAVRKMAELASEGFPNTRIIIISTLLPRTDTPPHVVHEMNMDIRRCAARPNVHPSHHPTIGTWYQDGLHLHKEAELCCSCCHSPSLCSLRAGRHQRCYTSCVIASF
ncbi:hypothetical protein EYF80_054658 [Liparis tanakae]|uniref:Uncharacterized protein n=1 Tax=Liparis tanakae TaxID=230148 RepID=A0A4Z2F1Z6_9TELE|nr:hypothetical protein EYF80_054658 [Liparis tanakae]